MSTLFLRNNFTTEVKTFCPEKSGHFFLKMLFGMNLNLKMERNLCKEVK